MNFATTKIDLAEEMARDLFGPDVAVAARDPRRDHGAIHPAEAAQVARAVRKRRLEFAAGRHAAAAALARLGREPHAVLAGPDRAPIWPHGILGSISHSDTACIAVLARATGCASVAVDVEEDAPLPDDLIDTICTPEEQARLMNVPSQGHRAKLIFSAKECAYKLQYPLTGATFGFDRIHIDADLDGGTFRAIFRQTTGGFPAGSALAGRFAVSGGLIVTAMMLRH